MSNKSISTIFLLAISMIIVACGGGSPAVSLPTNIPTTIPVILPTTLAATLNSSVEETPIPVPTGPFFQIYVTNVEKGATFKRLDGTESDPAPEGWQYIAVTYIVENKLKDAYVGYGALGVYLGDNSRYRWMPDGVLPFLPTRIVSSQGNEYRPIDLRFIGGSDDSYLLPPGYHLKTVMAFQVPKNQIGLVIELRGPAKEISLSKIALDTISINLDIQLPQSDGKDIADFKIGDTWEVPKIFKLTFNKVASTNTDCSLATNSNQEYVFIDATLENLTGQDMSPLNFSASPLFSSRQLLLSGVAVCGSGFGTVDPVPPGYKQQLTFRAAFQKGNTDLQALFRWKSQLGSQSMLLDLGK
jgi:hypothetical protein